MPTLTKNPPGVAEIVNRIVEKFHGGLLGAGVTIDILEARPRVNDNGDTEGCALKLHGYQCAAIMKVVSYKERVKGNADAELTIDGENWETLTMEEKEALVDHELEHLQLKLDGEGLLIRDDLDRPKLKIRLHDVQIGWFNPVARRHGPASIEWKQYDDFSKNRKQLWLKFDTDEEAVAEARNNVKPKGLFDQEAAEDAADPELQEAQAAVNKAADKAMKTVKKRQSTKGKRGGQRKLAGV